MVNKDIMILSAIGLLIIVYYTEISIESGPNMLEYVEAGGAKDTAKCPIKYEENWAVHNFDQDNLLYQFVSPAGLTCVKDSNGKFIGSYISAKSRQSATHRLEIGRTNFFFFDDNRLVKL